jgi:hypothetical protein
LWRVRAKNSVDSKNSLRSRAFLLCDVERHATPHDSGLRVAGFQVRLQAQPHEASGGGSAPRQSEREAVHQRIGLKELERGIAA